LAQNYGIEAVPALQRRIAAMKKEKTRYKGGNRKGSGVGAGMVHFDLANKLDE